MHTLYTVGHSNQSAESFVALLQRHHVARLADVRSSPYSQFVPQFNQSPLRETLAKVSIEYRHFGDALGARSPDPSCYVDGKVSYERLAKSAVFTAGLAQLIQCSAEVPTAIMCAERDPMSCHRALLVSRRLAQAEIDVQHILGDGTLLGHDNFEERLLSAAGLDDHDLFNALTPRADRLAMAYRGVSRDPERRQT